MRSVRLVLGMALALVGIVAPAWGLFHLIRQPSCGDVGMAACPDEVALWIVALVVSYTVLLPAAIFIGGRGSLGSMPRLTGPVLLAAPICLVMGVVWSLVGASSDPDTHWVGWLIAGLAGLFALTVARAIVRGRRMMHAQRAAAQGRPQPNQQPKPKPKPKQQPKPKQTPRPPAPAPPAPEADPELAELDAMIAADLQASREDLAQRLRTLDGLRESGVIDADEHRRRRDEILSEI